MEVTGDSVERVFDIVNVLPASILSAMIRVKCGNENF